MTFDTDRLDQEARNAIVNKKLAGKTVVCHEMNNDPNPVSAGTKGIVQFVDSVGQIHVQWSDGRTLALIPGVDRYIFE